MHTINRRARAAHVRRFAALLGYVAVVAGSVWGVLGARSWARRELTTVESQKAWESWQVESKRQSGGPQRDPAKVEGPVMRRAATSDRPPALALLEDHLAVCLFAAVFFSSILYGVIVLAAKGAMTRVPMPAEETPALIQAARSGRPTETKRPAGDS
jgi:hypothetical protein